MIDIQELIRNNLPIYVMNRTGRILEKPAPFILEIKDSNNRAYSVTIPAVKYPFLLTSVMPPHLLKDSTDFYSALSKGILEVVDPDEAREIMEDPLAQEVVNNAIRRFQPRKRTSPNPVATSGIAGERTDLQKTKKTYADKYLPPNADVGISAGDSTVDAEGNLRVAGKVGSTSDDVSPAVKQMVMDMNSDPGLEEDTLLHLAGMEDNQISNEDLGYILSEAADHKRVVKWAKKELAGRVGADVDEDAKPKRGRKRRK